MRLRPWNEASTLYESYQRIELDDEDAMYMPAYWAEQVLTP
jgi:hypothetical protein